MAGLLLCIAIGLGAPTAHAVTAAESFADGNRLFRDDLYWAALLRYRQAAEAGGKAVTALQHRCGAL